MTNRNKKKKKTKLLLYICHAHRTLQINIFKSSVYFRIFKTIVRGFGDMNVGAVEKRQCTRVRRPLSSSKS